MFQVSVLIFTETLMTSMKESSCESWSAFSCSSEFMATRSFFSTCRRATWARNASSSMSWLAAATLEIRTHRKSEYFPTFVCFSTKWNRRKTKTVGRIEPHHRASRHPVLGQLPAQLLVLKGQHLDVLARIVQLALQEVALLLLLLPPGGQALKTLLHWQVGLTQRFWDKENKLYMH